MKAHTFLTSALISLLVTACGGHDYGPAPRETRTYTVEVTNLTAGQPLSPFALVAHGGAFELFELGESASAPLEVLAEGGDNTDLLMLAESDSDVHSTVSGEGPVPPGAKASLMLTAENTVMKLNMLELDLVSMLVNTNDAIVAVRGAHLGQLAPGDSTAMTALAYDAGTEANTESADSIPGPAASGGAQEGYNASRDDVADRVHVHPGILGSDQGLAGSTLDQSHRWDNPVIRVVITRIE